jgi:hypothetical protein
MATGRKGRVVALAVLLAAAVQSGDRTRKVTITRFDPASVTR